MSLPAMFRLAKNVLQVCHPDVSQWALSLLPHTWNLGLCEWWCEYLCVPCKLSLISIVIKIQESPDSNFQIYMTVFCWKGWYDSVDGFFNSNISVRVVSSVNPCSLLVRKKSYHNFNLNHKSTSLCHYNAGNVIKIKKKSNKDTLLNKEWPGKK